MKLAIFSCGPRSYSTRRLKEAASQRGYDVKVLNTLKFAIDLQGNEPDLYFRQKTLSEYDAVLPRIGASITYYGTAVVRQFQKMDVFCANTAHGILNSRDKLRSLQLLSRHHIGIPDPRSSETNLTFCRRSNESAVLRSSSSSSRVHRASAFCSQRA